MSLNFGQDLELHTINEAYPSLPIDILGLRDSIQAVHVRAEWSEPAGSPHLML